MPYCCRSIQQVIIHLRTFNWKVHNSATLIFRGGKRKCISKKLKSRVTKSAWQPLIFHTEKTDTANNSQVIHGLYTWGGKAYGRMRLPADPWLYQGQGDLRLAPIPLTLTSFAIASDCLCKWVRQQEAVKDSALHLAHSLERDGMRLWCPTYTFLICSKSCEFGHTSKYPVGRPTGYSGWFWLAASPWSHHLVAGSMCWTTAHWEKQK